jgi:phospholipid transport system transporter-binding protein
VTPASIAATGEDALLVSGDLVFSTVGGLLERAGPMLATARNPVVDLASVVNCDSAGLALLLEWVAVGARAGKRVRFLNLPQAMAGIARLSNADTLLPMAE